MAAKDDTATARKHAKSAKGSKRRQAPRNLWTKRAAPLQLGRIHFRFSLRRGARRLPALNIDAYVESCSWERAGKQRIGALAFRVPLTGRQAAAIAHGDVVRCEVSTNGTSGWQILWQMVVQDPSHSVAAGTISVQLASRLAPLEKSSVSFKFKKDRQHPRGWRADEITRAVGRRFRVRVGRLARATHWITKLIDTDTTPTDILQRAWNAERLHTGRRFDIDGSRGLLEVREIREPAYMLLLGPAIIDATIEHGLRNVFSAVVVSTSVKRRGRRPRKLQVKVVAEGRVRRYGYVVKRVRVSSIDTAAELRRYGKRLLARSMRPKRDLTFTHAGIPWLDRGDAVTVRLPDADLDVLCFVKSVRHNLAPGNYTVEVTVGWSDPFAADKRKARVAQKKAAAARRRRRGRGDRPAPPQAKKAHARR